MFSRLYQQQHQEQNDQESENHESNAAELSILERELCKQNFLFYDKQKQGYVERFELPMVLTSKSASSVTHVQLAGTT